MELLTYLRIIKRRKWVALGVSIVVTLAVAVAVVLTPPTYTAEATLRVLPPTSGRLDYAELLYLDRLMSTYAEVATSGPMLAELSDRLGFDIDHPPQIEIEVIADTELLQITVKDPDPLMARATAQAITEILTTASPIRDSRALVLAPATLLKTSPLMLAILKIALGVVVGLAFGVALAFLWENLDTRLYSSPQIETLTGVRILGEIPTAGMDVGDRLLMNEPLHREVFRRLCLTLFLATAEGTTRTILITSAEPEEGKSTISVNLATSLAQHGKKCTLVDADLRRPKIHRAFELPNETGLSTVLNGNAELSEALADTYLPRLKVLVSGSLPSDPAEMLTTDGMENLLESLANGSEVVLIDSPAFQAVADSVVLASMVDGVLLVVRSGWVRRAVLQSTCQQLDAVGANILGVIVNRAEQVTSTRYRKYYYREQVQPVPVTHPGEGLTGDSPPAGEEPDTQCDPLTDIGGIGKIIEKQLYDLGVTSFEQLAAQDPADLARRMDNGLGISSELCGSWIEQAKARTQPKVAEAK